MLGGRRYFWDTGSRPTKSSTNKWVSQKGKISQTKYYVIKRKRPRQKGKISQTKYFVTKRKRPHQKGKISQTKYFVIKRKCPSQRGKISHTKYFVIEWKRPSQKGKISQTKYFVIKRKRPSQAASCQAAFCFFFYPLGATGHHFQIEEEVLNPFVTHAKDFKAAKAYGILIFHESPCAAKFISNLSQA